MSGSAALSAARKRRASSAPMAGSAPTSQQIYNGRAPYANEQPTFIQPYPQQLPGSGIPPQPMNIYENIELIKQQLVERTKLIQTQGSSLPAERLAVLHKQNEIQTQILKQKIAIAKQLEMTNPEQAQMLQRVLPTMATSEPEFIYEKGVPRRNPNYKSGSPVFQKAPEPPKANTSIKPFVSMISDTGVIPPPIVILKSHDATLAEYHHILTNVLHQLGDLHEQVKTGGASSNSVYVQQPQQKERTLDAVEEGDEGVEGDEEEELLMDVVMNDLTNSREFVEGIVNKIVNETNLSEVIMKIEPLVRENQELRSLIHSQQQMMNEMNTMLLRLLNQNNSPAKTFQDNGLDSDGLYPSETTEIVISEPIKEGNSGMDESMGSSSETSVDAHTEATEVADGVQVPQEENNANDTTEGIVNNDSQQQQHQQEEVSESAHDQDDDYSSPHFPTDPVSLIVQEIQ